MTPLRWLAALALASVACTAPRDVPEEIGDASVPAVSDAGAQDGAGPPRPTTAADGPPPAPDAGSVPPAAPPDARDAPASPPPPVDGAVAPEPPVCARATCGPADGCCPMACSGATDPDCVRCDDGQVHPGETCDPLTTCPGECAKLGCMRRRLDQPATCRARCVDDGVETSCTSDDGCCPAGCSGNNDTDCVMPNRVFVTSLGYNANLGGLAGADARCAERARAAGLTGRFLALLSTSQVSAASRFAGSRGWLRTDGRPFTNDLWGNEAVIHYPPRADEMGRPLYDHGVSVMTSTRVDGQGKSPFCLDWTSISQVLNGQVSGGDPGSVWTIWVEGFTSGYCDQLYRLYCLEVGRRSFVPPPPPPPRDARLAFIEPEFPPSGGIQDADRRCAAAAKAANLPGTFLALLATSNRSAASRFDLQGAPWFRPDGVQVVATAADLAANRLLAPVRVLASGAPTLVPVWTGAPEPGQPGDDTCQDWTAAPGTSQGRTGRAYESDRDWFDSFDGKTICSPNRAGIYCFSQ
jgi:hypothetical protein